MDLREIDVIHLDKLIQCLQSIFKSDLGLLSNTSHVSHHQCLIFWKIQDILVPEFETFVQLYFGYDISGDYWQLQDVGKVLSQLDRVHSLNASTSQLSYFTQRVDVAFFTCYRDDADSDTLWFCEFSKFLIEFVCLVWLDLGFYFIEGAQTNVGQSIGTQNDRRARISVCGQSDGWG